MTISTEIATVRQEMLDVLAKIKYEESIILQNREGFLKRLEKLDFGLYEDTLKGHYGMNLASLFSELNKLEGKIKKL